MLKRKLMKHTLPVILSMAMVFQSFPVTVIAAEYKESETTAEAIMDEAAEEMQELSSTSEVETTDDAETYNNVSNPDNAKQAASKEVAATHDTGDMQNATEEDYASTTTEGESVQIPETSEITETTVLDKPDDMDKSDSEAELVVDYEGLQTSIAVKKGYYDAQGNWVDLRNFRYDTETKTVITTYSKDLSNPFEKITALLKDTNEAYSLIRVFVDKKDKTNLLKTYVKYQWEQKDAEGNYTPMASGTFPVNAGDYKLVVSLDAVPGAYKAAQSQTIQFRIDPREITIEYHDANIVVPGTTVMDVKKKVLEKYTLSDGLNKDAYVANAVVSIKNATGDKGEIGDDFRLLKTGDYLIELTIEFANETYANNYLCTNSTVNIEMSDAIPTVISVTSRKADGSELGKVYDGEAIDVKNDVEAYFEAVVGEADGVG
nr:hypothetical protein [Lachnospiraceae bacterium]